MSKLVNITGSALKRLIKMQYNNNSNYILFSAKGGGCNGFGYKLEPTNDDPDKFDEVVRVYDVESNKQLNMQICGRSLLYLLGTEIDWKEDFMGARFVFENPQAKSKCGCGTSFSI